jgi:hypothetical protein
MDIMPNKGTLKMMFIVIVTLLIINIVTSAVPTLAQFKSKLGLA